MNNEPTKPSEAMVERVARAIHSINVTYGAGKVTAVWDNCSQSEKDQWIRFAQAALSAITDPIGVIDGLMNALRCEISKELIRPRDEVNMLADAFVAAEQFKQEWCNAEKD